ADFDEFPQSLRGFRDQLAGRSMLVKKTEPLTIECVVRGYLAGSGWKDYQQNGSVCGVKLPDGLQLASKLPGPIFTPSTKSDVGHDLNIDLDRAGRMVGARLGQNAARAPFAAGDRGENERKIPRSFFASYRWETRVTQASCLWGQRGSSRLQDSGMMPVMPAAED